MLELIAIEVPATRIDAIVTMYPEALHFLLRTRASRYSPALPLWPCTCRTDIEMPEDGSAGESSGTPLGGYRGTLEIALKLVPDAKQVFVVSGAHKVDRRQEERARRGSEEVGRPR